LTQGIRNTEEEMGRAPLQSTAGRMLAQEGWRTIRDNKPRCRTWE